MSEVKIDNISIGDEYECKLVAEVGSFFNQDIHMAINYLEMASEAGVEIFKTEIIHNPDICLNADQIEVTYNTASNKVSENYRKFIERKVIKLSEYEKLFSHAEKLGISIIATVFDQKGVDFLKNNNGKAIKISRNNIRHYSLIKSAANSNLPIIYDLGDVLLSEALKAREITKSLGNDQIIFNYHPIFNPATAEEHDLKSIQRYKELLNTPVGLSCHYSGDILIYAAIGAGANIIEKGVDIDPNRSEADIVSACSFNELKEILSNIKLCSSALGSSEPNVDKSRLSKVEPGLIASKDIQIGEKFSSSNVGFAWPALGINSEYFELVEGKVSKQFLEKGRVINWMDLEDGEY